jgi:hydroxypyruvate reductase
VPDPSTCADALAICRRYRLTLPEAARAGLESGAFETPKPGDACFRGHDWRLIATPQASLEAAAEAARRLGLAAHILSDEVEGESREVGKVHAALARAVARRGQPFARPCVILSGGETTVTLPPGAGGRGGRSLEGLLGLALALEGHAGIWALMADTDGIDGRSDAAGGIAAPDSLARARALGIDPRAALAAHDSYGVFQALGDLVVTGPTLTNVNDVRAVLVA